MPGAPKSLVGFASHSRGAVPGHHCPLPSPGMCRALGLEGHTRDGGEWANAGKCPMAAWSW